MMSSNSVLNQNIFIHMILNILFKMTFDLENLQ